MITLHIWNAEDQIFYSFSDFLNFESVYPAYQCIKLILSLTLWSALLNYLHNIEVLNFLNVMKY